MTARRGFTLIEMLVVMFLFAVLSISAGTFLVDAWRAMYRTEQRLLMNQSVPAIHDFWRGVLRETQPDLWRMDDGRLRAGEVTVGRVADRLVYRRGDLERAVPLPAIAETRIHIERGGQTADRAILTLAWSTRRLSTVTSNHVRLVACGRGNHDPR